VRKVIALPADVQLSGNMLAFVVWWIAAFILCFGSDAFRNARFPLCFLLWLVPFPAFLLDPIVELLQRGSAASAHWLFAAARVPVEQRGMLLHIPDLTLEVAPECSSIRSSLILLVTTMVVAQLLLRSTWRKAVVVAVAIPLSVAKNGLRIFVIGMLATRVDPRFLTGRLHRQGGVIFLLIALAAIFLVIWILRRGEEEQATSEVAIAKQGDHRR
jgi:exosortase